jgi:uncharacterized protein involved in outer membrane biogenesis
MAMSFATSWRLRRWAIGVAAAIALFGLAGWLGIPALVRWGIESVGSRELGRTLRVAEVSANPFTMRVTARGLTMAEADAAAAPFVAIDALTVNLSTASLLHRAPVLDALRIDGMRINVVRTEPQRFNFSDVIERLQQRPAATDAPARFAVHNIEVEGSAIDFDDRVQGVRHRVTDLRLGVPFLSSFATDAEIHVQPSFAAHVNGTPLELRGETLPFDQTLESAVQLSLAGLDLPTYLGYLPLRLNFAVPRGTLDADLRIAFRRAMPAREGSPARGAELVISGRGALRDFALAVDAKAEPMVAWQRLAVSIGELAPLAGRLRLDDVTLEAPQLRVVRGRDGSIDWQNLAQAPLQPSSATPPARAPAPAATAAAPVFGFSLARLVLRDGRLHYIDEPLGRFEQTIEGLSIDLSGLTNASHAPPATFKLDGRLQPQGRLSLAGELALAPLAGRIAVGVEDLALRSLERVVKQSSDGTLDGAADLRGEIGLASVDGATQVTLRAWQVEGRKLQLRGPKDSAAMLDLEGLRLDGVDVDLDRRSVRATRLALDAPRVGVSVLADGSLGWERVLRAPARAGQAGPAAPVAAESGTGWSIALGELALARGQLRFEDASVEPAARISLSQLQGSVRNLTADGSTRAELALRTRVGEHGTLAINGGLRWDRLLANLRYSARNLDVGNARGYLARFVNAALVSGDLSARGTLALVQPREGPLRVSVESDLRLANLHLTDVAGANDLLRWQSLAIDRVALAFGEGEPQVDVGAVALETFYARVILSEQGRLNLADLFQRPVPAEQAAAGAKAAGAVPPAEEAPAARPRVRIDRIQLAGGNINFTDNFVKPNYSANLTDLAGSVSTLASDAAEPATLELAGRVDGDAPLAVRGRINPLAPKLLLDIAGSTKGVDLPRLTPYSAKYAGYPITKGKLSLDVRYQVKDDKLSASNRLFLDQLTFGERVDSPDATKLPVLLAVALLKNRRGEIDINLPISGSLDDPHFSIGGIIIRVIVNLIGKALTSPFSLLAAAFGGGEELGKVEFAPGRASLEPAQVDRLQTLARALADRPALRLDIAGRADAAIDTPGLRDAAFESRLRAAKIRQLVRAGGASIDPAEVTIGADERPALIAAVYAAEPIADKPRVLGIARSLPTAEMERRIRAHLALAPVDLRALANARADAVRTWLETQGKVPRERMFVVEPKLAESAKADDAMRAAATAVGVEFTLK